MAVRKLNNNLRKYWKEKHLSQADLTIELNPLEINLYKNDVYMIENNKGTIKDYEIWSFIKVFNITFDDLFAWIENKLEN